MKYWETIADRLSVAGYTWGYCRTATRYGWRYIVDAHCRDGRRFIIESDEILTAFLELEANLVVNQIYARATLSQRGPRFCGCLVMAKRPRKSRRRRFP